MDHGRIIARGTPPRLISDHVSPRVIEVHGAEAAEREISAIVGDAATEVETLSDRYLVYGSDGAEIARRLRESGLAHQALLERDATLEDVFLRLTGHTLVD